MRVRCTVCGVKNVFPSKCKFKFTNNDEIYSDYCPNIESLKKELSTIEECEECGYVFPSIDEDTDVTEDMVDDPIYKFPFGKEYDGAIEAVKCFKIALTYHSLRCNGLAAKWYIYAALFLNVDMEVYKQKCYRNAMVLLKHRIELLSGRDTEYILAYFNVMRLAKIYNCVIDMGNEELLRLENKNDVGIEKKLLKTIIDLSQNKDSTYMTYFEMLLLN